MKMCPLNITIFHQFLYRITTGSTKSLFLHRFEPNVKKTGCTKKSRLTFNIKRNLFLRQIQISKK